MGADKALIPAGASLPHLRCASVSGSQAAIRVLGATRLEGSQGEIVALGGTLPRGFLAVLALEAGRPVSIDRLTSLLWGDDAPGGVKAALQQLASRVRRALSVCGLGDILRAVPPGYQLDVAPELIDALMFRARVRIAAEAHRTGDYEGAAENARDALALWRGNAFADLVELPMFAALGPGLDDERWRTEELRAEALLAIGRPAEAAEHLAVATALEPLRERLWVLEVSALVAAGRPSEAVRCARTGIAVITAELGVPPGPDLAGIEARLRDEQPAVVIALPRRAIAARQGLLDGALRRALLNAEQAARAAAARRAHGEAVHQWQRALELLDTVAPDDDRQRLRLLLGLGVAHNMASLDAEARPVFSEAADIARRLGDHEGLAWAALGYCSDHIAFAPPPEQAAILIEALAGLDDTATLLRGRLLARLATEQYWTGSVDRTLELAEEAAQAADAAGDVEGRLLAHYARAFGCWTPDRTPRLVEVCEAYLADARVAGDRYHELLAHRWLVPAVTELGDVARGGVEATRAIELADDLQLSEQQWVSRVIAASHQLVVGDLARAEQLATEALALGSVCEPLVALDYVSLFMWTLRWMQGRLDEIASLIEEAAATPGVDVPRRMGLAVTRGRSWDASTRVARSSMRSRPATSTRCRRTLPGTSHWQRWRRPLPRRTTPRSQGSCSRG